MKLTVRRRRRRELSFWIALVNLSVVVHSWTRDHVGRPCDGRPCCWSRRVSELNHRHCAATASAAGDGSPVHEETLIEQRMRLFWESDPFDIVKYHVRSMIRQDSAAEGKRLGFRPLLDEKGSCVHTNTTDSVFAPFYEGRFPRPSRSLLIRNQTTGTTSRRRKRSYRLDLAYDGRHFCGWQRQLSDELHNNNQTNLPSVQSTIENAFLSFHETPTVDVRVAGRTDAGVHAVGQVGRVRLDMSSRNRHATGATEESCSMAEQEQNEKDYNYLYQQLLECAARADYTWRCWRVTAVPETFHPTFGAQARSYLYMIDAEAILNLLVGGGGNSVVNNNNNDLLERFGQCCNTLLSAVQGEQMNFFSLSYGKGINKDSSWCLLSLARTRILQCVPGAPTDGNDEDESILLVPRDEPYGNRKIVLVFELTGNRFLRRMVRKLVATVLQLALLLLHDAKNNNRPYGSLDQNSRSLVVVLQQHDRRASAAAAPAAGLVLVHAAID